MTIEIVLATLALTSSGADWSQSGPPEADATDQSAEETEDTENQDVADDSNGSDPQGGSVVGGLYLGAGVGLTHTVSGSRGDEILLVELENGDVFAQLQRSENTDIRVLFETHYLFENQSILMGWRRDPDSVAPGTPIDPWLSGLGALAACGPFSLVDALGDLGRRGCGPFFAAAVDPDASVAEFGAGWMVAFGRNGNALDNFGFGIGFIIDPDSKLLDTRIIDRETMLVRDEFEAAALNGDVSLTTEETSVSLMMMVSRSF